MVCDRCGPSRDEGYSFCPNCGNQLKEGCLYCAQYERDGYEYCGKCGRHLERKETQTSVTGKRNPLKMGTMASVPFIVMGLILEIAGMLYFSGEGLSYVSDNGTKLFLLLPMIVAGGRFDGAVAQAYFVLIMATILISVALVLYQSIRKMRPRADGDTSEAENTPLYSIGMLFGSGIILELIIMGIMTVFGHGLSTPEWIGEMSLGETVFDMAEAAFIEEIASRMVIIGVPIALLALCYGKRDFLMYLLGGFGMSRVALILLIASTIIFAYAHVGSWGFEKFLPTLVGGLCLGYLYIKYGIHASIVFHFLTDYMSVMLQINEVVTAAWLLIILVAGVVCLAEVLKRTLDGLRSVKDLPITGLDDEDSERE